MNAHSKSVLLLGATGTIGQATAQALLAASHDVIAPVRAGANTAQLPSDIITNHTPAEVLATGQVDAIISCLASRTGTPSDAWAVDYMLNSDALKLAIKNDVAQFILLSAICVQKPRLAFQHAKLAFEGELQAAPLTWSIVRPTAYFKSLSGQITRLKADKPFLTFGDGLQTVCKPISDTDLARYLVNCLDTPAQQNRILPIGGPGPAITPRDQGTLLFEALEKEPRFQSVPMWFLPAVATALTPLGWLSTKWRDKAALARIGHYYATESMLLWNAETQSYDADATPSFGDETLADHYAKLANGDAPVNLGDHAMF